MTSRTPSRSRRALWIALLVAVVVAGWLAGRAVRDPAPAPTPPPSSTSMTRPARPELPSLAPAGPADIVPDAKVHPRPAGEWQGMLVDLSQRQVCEASSYCGFALACLDDGACGACQRDDQCAGGEVCVLDHCVLAANAGCRSRRDCAGEGDDALCVLSGLTGGEARGNGAMTSYCQASRGGIAQDPTVVDERRAARLAAAAAQTPVAPPVSEDDLRARLEAAPAP